MSTLVIHRGPSSKDLGRKLISGEPVSFSLNTTNRITSAPKRSQLRFGDTRLIKIDQLSCEDPDLDRVDWKFTGRSEEGVLVNGRYDSHIRKGTLVFEEE